MEKFVLFNLIFVMVISAIFASGNSDSIRGNGDVVTLDRTLLDFEKIQITTAFSNNNYSDGKCIVRIHSSEEYRLSITIDSNLNQYVEINVINNILKIETIKKMKNDFFVDIYSPTISGISIVSIGRVEMIDTIKVSLFSIKITGAGEIDGKIECEDLSVDVDGAGKLTMIGHSNDANINISGACKFNGEEFRINNVSVRIGGAGRATIWATDNLIAGIYGIGSIRYRGSPNVQFTRGGLGSIKKIR